MIADERRGLISRLHFLFMILILQASVRGYITTYKHRIPVVFLKVSKATSVTTASTMARGMIIKRNMRLFEMTSTASPPSPRTRSFVQDELRPYAMKLHTRDQSREGQKEANKTPFTKWTPTLQNYLQFLVDSLKVYETFEKLIAVNPRLVVLRNTGLERTDALKQDIQWILEFDPTLIVPQCSPAGHQYANFLESLIQQEHFPRFICHYYNFYFAHTAGGRMIGAKISDLLLNGVTLKFFQWDQDVKLLIDQTKTKIDEIALQWDDQEKKDCLEETLSTFQYGESLMMSIISPQR